MTDTPTVTPTATATPSETVTFTPTDTPTPSATPTITPTPTVTPTLGVLGIRHFVLNKSRSTFQVRIPPGVNIPVGNFEGQTNGVTEPAFLDLEAGQPDAQGITKVNVVRASEYIFANAPSAGFVFCIKLQVPAPEAGILACNGGVDISIALNVDHNIGEVGVNGFTAAQCEALQGHVEVPYSTCGAGLVGQLCEADADCDTSEGSNDGACTNHFPGTCVAGKTGAVCQRNADCDAGSVAGFCGAPHGGVCNGPLVPVIESGDTGPGALVIAPNPEPPYQINGIPVTLNFESDLPCGNEGPGIPSPFALTTGTMRSAIMDANDDPGHQLNFQTTGENFSCYDWQGENRGRFVLSAPALDQYIPLSHIYTDVATMFNFWSH
jgi:hypothetical protein